MSRNHCISYLRSGQDLLWGMRLDEVKIHYLRSSFPSRVSYVTLVDDKRVAGAA